jgi:hypothetical protein
MESLKSYPLGEGLVSGVMLESNRSTITTSWTEHYSHLLHVKRDPR